MTNPTMRLAVFLDGTDNTPKDRTNVWRAHELLAPADGNNVPQKKIYIRGVGTDFGDIAAGSIFGVGVAAKIREGYEWLLQNYQDGAEVYIFGFSRGAFSARSLVQMIATCGLVRPECLSDIDVKRVFERYESITRQEEESVHPIWRLRYWKDHPDKMPPDWVPDPDDALLMDDAKVRLVKIKMAGLWDTVGALGADIVEKRGVNIQKAAAHNVRPTKAQEYGYHAIAVDEHRPMFDVTLWRTFVPNGDSQQLRQENEARKAEYRGKYEQRWFIGAHSDVGGGYGDDDLPDLSLRWMMDKASALGLAFAYSVEPRAGIWHAKIHDSFESFAGGVLTIWDQIIPGDQRNYRKIRRLPKQVTTVDGTGGELWSINETIDDSVLLRVIEDNTYRPPNLVDYFREKCDGDENFRKDTFSQFIPPADVAAGIFPKVFTQRTRRIYANKYWNESGVFLRAGRSYRIKVVPNVGEPLRDANNIARNIEGEEWDSSAYKTAAFLHGKRKDDAKWFSLIGTIEKAQPWVIKDNSTFSVKSAGQLVCYFNDVQLEWFYKNNSGWVVLELEEVEEDR